MKDVCAKRLLAASRQAGSEPIRASYRRAARAIKAHPEPITSPDDLQRIKGVGPFILSYLKSKVFSDTEMAGRTPVPPPAAAAASSAGSGASHGSSVTITATTSAEAAVSGPQHPRSSRTGINDSPSSTRQRQRSAARVENILVLDDDDDDDDDDESEARGVLDADDHEDDALPAVMPLHTSPSVSTTHSTDTTRASAHTLLRDLRVAQRKTSDRPPAMPSAHAPYPPLDAYAFPPSPPPSVRKKRANSTGRRRSRAATATATEHRARPSTSTSSQQQEQQNSSKGKGARKKQPRLPAKGSGAYGILMAFFTARQDPEFERRGSYLLKSELQAAAQPHCNTSYTRPEKTGYYTAWASMSTMVRRGWATRRSSPAKYSLADAGWAMAEAVAARDGNNNVSNSTASSSTGSCSASQTAAALSHISYSSSSSSSNGHAVSSRRSPSSIASRTALHSTGTSAHGALGRSSTVQGAIGGDDYDDDSDVVVVLDDDDDDDYGGGGGGGDDGSGDVYSVEMTTNRLTTKRMHADATHPLMEGHRAKAPKVSKRRKSFESRSSPTGSSATTTAISTPVSSRIKQETAAGAEYGMDPHAAVAAAQARPATTTTAATTTAAATTTSLSSLSSSSSSSSSARGTTSGPSARSLPRATLKAFSAEATCVFTLDPGTYDVVLLIDNREYQVKQRDRGADLQESLLAQDVLCEVRQLALGDYTWIVKEKLEIARREQREPREVCLSFLVERKRYDDFAQSIMYRGRMSSQTHRFHAMQIMHPVLLVEEYRIHAPTGVDETRIRQSTCNLQVESGFFVKMVANMREVEAYLVLCTRMVQQLLQGCPIESWVPRDRACTHLRSFPGWGQPAMGRVLSFDMPTFHRITRRAAVGTVREVFAHQLMHLTGLTTKMALLITDRFPTPARFTDALRAAWRRDIEQRAHDDDDDDKEDNDNDTTNNSSSSGGGTRGRRKKGSRRKPTALSEFWESIGTPGGGKVTMAVRAKLQAFYLPRVGGAA